MKKEYCLNLSHEDGFTHYYNVDLRVDKVDEKGEIQFSEYVECFRFERYIEALEIFHELYKKYDKMEGELQPWNEVVELVATRKTHGLYDEPARFRTNARMELVEVIQEQPYLFEINRHYWDCECVQYYIHKRTDSSRCFICGIDEDDMPDSREAEVAEGVYFFNDNPLLMDAIKRTRKKNAEARKAEKEEA
tara:strand:- start:1296 stop:1871 length:576 start_codon:yes stop_codon:yes gene_type:complete